LYRVLNIKHTRKQHMAFFWFFILFYFIIIIIFFFCYGVWYMVWTVTCSPFENI